VLKVRIYVTLKPSVLDPQGKAVRGALHSLGFTEAEDVRVGKFIELELSSSDRKEAAGRVEQMCDKLLANPVIESYRFEIEEEARA